MVSGVERQLFPSLVLRDSVKYYLVELAAITAMASERVLFLRHLRVVRVRSARVEHKLAAELLTWTLG